MRERGIALDPLGARAARVLKLDVSQDVAPLTSMLFRAEAASECCLWVKIVNLHLPNNRPQARSSAEMPFTQDVSPGWMIRYPSVRSSYYQLPFSRDCFSRGDVINHLLRKTFAWGARLQVLARSDPSSYS